MLIADIGIAVLAIGTAIGSFWLGARRDDAGRKNAVLAQSISWNGGPWEGVARLTKMVSEKAGSDFVAYSAKHGEPPPIVQLLGGSYVRQERARDDEMWQYVWRAGTEVRDRE